VHCNDSFLYFEYHDVGNFARGSFDDPANKTIINDTFLAGTLRGSVHSPSGHSLRPVGPRRSAKACSFAG
jgi:hypothetical protein